MELTDNQHIYKKSNYLESQQQVWNPIWQEAAKWVAPHKAKFLNQYDSNAADVSSESESAKRILDSTASRSVRVLAAGLQSGLTSPARPWFRLRLSGENSVESGPERRWLDVVEELLYSALGGSNFYQAVHSLYTELAIFGSSCMYIESDPDKLIRFASLNCGEFSWGINASGLVDTVLRTMRLPIYQVAQKWGEDNLSKNSKKLLAKSPESLCTIKHLVTSRATTNLKNNHKLSLPFASYIWEKGSESENKLLSHSGYNEFPFLCARWDVQGMGIYGRSPVMEVLPDIRMLQEMTKSQILAIHKVVNPPMRVPVTFKQRLSLIPGAINYVSSSNQDGISPLYQISPDINAITRKIADIRESIKQGLFTDLFLMFASDNRSNITATEINERSQEKLLLLGPVIERHQTEILDPLLERTYGILDRAGELPSPPESLEGKKLQIEYVSSLAQAQRQGGADAIRRLVAEVANLSSISPNVTDKIDFDQVVDELADITGVSSRIIRSDSEVANLRSSISESSDSSNNIMENLLSESQEDLPIEDILNTVLNND